MPVAGVGIRRTSGSLPTQPQMVLEVLSHPPILRCCSFRMKEQGGQALFGNPGVDSTAASTLTVPKH